MTQQQPTLETYSMNLGSLRSSIELTLHTYHAVRAWQGGQPTGKAGYTVPSMQAFFGVTNLIKFNSSQDNPYADWWMIQIEERLDAADQSMRELSGMMDELITNAAVQLSVSDNLNQRPFSTPLFCSSHMGFRAVYLLEAYDQLARKVLLANHIALLTRRDMEGYLDQGAHMLRSIFHFALTYKNTGVTREDMKQQNAKAAAAIERFGTPPSDILDGSRRSDYAPNITRGENATEQVDVQETNDDASAKPTENNAAKPENEPGEAVNGKSEQE